MTHNQYHTALTTTKIDYLTGQPDCLAAELRSYQPQLSLRSSSKPKELLTVPHCKTMLGRRHFSVAAPRVWNSLPLCLKVGPCKHYIGPIGEIFSLKLTKYRLVAVLH